MCQQDITHDYGQVEPDMQRCGVSGHATANGRQLAEDYAELNYEQSYSSYTGLASIIRANAPAGIDYPALIRPRAGEHRS